MGLEKPKQYNRLQISVTDQFMGKVESYADMMGISTTDAARHLMMRGLEQVQMMVNAQESSRTLKNMVEVFDRGLEMEEKKGKPASRKKGKKVVEGLVTPPQSLKNETKAGVVRDVFEGLNDD